MADEYGDVPKTKPAVVKKAQNLDIEVEFEEPKEVIPNKNIVTLNGKDYVLAPIS